MAYSILAANLKHLREEAHYTQDYLSHILKVTPSAYSNYENGIRLPDVYKLLLLSKLYHTSIEKLMMPSCLFEQTEETVVPRIELTEHEKLLLYYYRNLADPDQQEIQYLIQYKASRADAKMLGDF